MIASLQADSRSTSRAIVLI